MEPRRTLVALALFLLTIALWPLAAVAQESTGGIQGTVSDQSGAVVPGAAVELNSPALITPQKRTSDSAGFYRFLNLPPGVYVIDVTATGFRKYRETSINLMVGKLLPVDVKLEVGAVTQTVEVQATPIIVDTTQSKIAVNVTSDQIASIPKGRSFADLITFAPGARYEPLQSDLTATTNPGAYPGYQVDGASDSENVYALEGLDTSDIYGGGVGMNVPVDFVQELEIKSSGFEAEYGGALGGVVNIVTKKGGNNWHGSGLFYYRSDVLTGMDRPTLRTNPLIAKSGRIASPAEYYQPKSDSWRVIEPGFDLGGYLKKDMVWLYASYLPSMQSLTRRLTFTPSAANITKGYPSGLQSFPRSDKTHRALGRLDVAPANWVRLGFNWDYQYRRWWGNLPAQDSAFGQYSSVDYQDARTFSAARGQVMPNSAYVASAYFTISPKMLASVRWGLWLSDTQDRGTPTGTRYQWRNSSVGLVGLNGQTIPAASSAGMASYNIPDNFAIVYDKFRRMGLSADWSWYVRGGGAHTLKAGYAMNRIENNTLQAYNTARVLLEWGYDARDAYDTMTILPELNTNCAPIIAYNLSHYGVADTCMGVWGTYVVRDYSTAGKAASYNHSIYVQDAWTVGKRLTLNLGVRFDKEYLPSFSKGPEILSTPISFGFFDKVAPRVGAAYDVLGNGKLKIYGSWGMYYDIMKYAMPRGSFGGDWWKDCWYTLDDPDYTKINPVLSNSHTCPSGGGTPGTLLTTPDWRIPSNDVNSAPPEAIAGQVNGRIDKNLKPMRSRRIDLGSEYALRPNLGLDFRYTRNRMDYTIEDAAILGPNGEEYYITNPGFGITQLMLKDDCPTCPPMPKAIRNYDGLEVRLTKRWAQNWFANTSYTYSRLWGNYSGLTSTEIGDAGGGRHDPNVSRYFDLVQQAFDAHGHVSEGYLPTDRPHTVKFYGAYRAKWFAGESTFGVSQFIYSGVPWTTEVNMISSTPVHPEGIGNWVPVTRDAAGVITAGPTQFNHRGPAYTNTDLLFTHDFKLSKTNENLRATFEVNVSNLFNQRHTLRYFINPLYSGTIDMDLQTFFQGFNWASALNNQTPALAFDNRYGMGDVFSLPRQLRFKLKISF
jgi:outer membrane receptor protein involved in Fe transport